MTKIVTEILLLTIVQAKQKTKQAKLLKNG